MLYLTYILFECHLVLRSLMHAYVVLSYYKVSSNQKKEEVNIMYKLMSNFIYNIKDSL